VKETKLSGCPTLLVTECIFSIEWVHDFNSFMDFEGNLEKSGVLGTDSAEDLNARSELMSFHIDI
jgi:hypothetical protein